MQAYLCIIEKSFSGKVLLPLLMENELVGYWSANFFSRWQSTIAFAKENELVGYWSAKILSCIKLRLLLALILSSTPSFTSGNDIKVGAEAKGKGPGSGPGGHRAQETHEQAAKAKRGERPGGKKK